jgi:biotin synthase
MEIKLSEIIMWDKAAVEKLYATPFLELVFKAQTKHREYFKADEVELCTLLNIKTGGCPENCAYCPQSAHYNTGLQREKLMSLDEVKKQVTAAKENGATRFCMGAAWRSPPTKEFPAVIEMVKTVREMGMEACLTAGMLSENQAQELKTAGLDFYNHNLDTSPEYYENIITTHTYQERLDTLHEVRSAGIKVCSGGILGLGESREDRIAFLLQLANLPVQPESVPLNRLIPIKGTPLAETQKIDNLEFIRTVAVARIMMPKAMVRLTAGRESMSEEMQTLCFLAGANSIHFGEKLLVTSNPTKHQDLEMFSRLGLQPKPQHAAM